MRLLRWVFGSWVVWRFFGPTLKPRFKAPQEHPWRLSGRTVFVGDEEFLVREAGPEDGDPILLIHGLGGSSLGEWYQIGPKLATYRRVIMVDHRNHGMAPQASQRYEVEDVADDIAAVLDDLGVGASPVPGSDSPAWALPRFAPDTSSPPVPWSAGIAVGCGRRLIGEFPTPEHRRRWLCCGSIRRDG